MSIIVNLEVVKEYLLLSKITNDFHISCEHPQPTYTSVIIKIKQLPLVKVTQNTFHNVFSEIVISQRHRMTSRAQSELPAEKKTNNLKEYNLPFGYSRKLVPPKNIF